MFMEKKVSRLCVFQTRFFGFSQSAAILENSRATAAATASIDAQKLKEGIGLRGIIRERREEERREGESRRRKNMTNGGPISDEGREKEGKSTGEKEERKKKDLFPAAASKKGEKSFFLTLTKFSARKCAIYVCLFLLVLVLLLLLFLETFRHDR
jgi:hypothetical protein